MLDLLEPIWNIVGYISMYSILLPLIGILIFWKSIPENKSSIKDLIIFWVIVQFIASYHYLFGLSSNLPIVNVGTIIELALIVRIFWTYNFTAAEKRIYFIVITLYAVFTSWYYIQNGLATAAPLVITLQGVIVISLMIGYLVKLVLKPIPDKFIVDILFWFASGSLIYFTGNLSYFIFRPDIISMDKDIQYLLGIGYDSLNIIYNFLVFLGILYGRQQQNK